MKASYATTAGAVAAACRGKVVSGDSTAVIRTVSSDSRDLGPAALFVALRGDRFDGHDFIADLARDGKITACLAMRGTDAPLPGVSVIRCADTLAALGDIAARHRGSVRTRLAGITGTNGKTTTKELAHRILSSRFSCLKSEKNYNNLIGVPFALLGLEPSHEFAVIEMGMSARGEIERLSGICAPDAALITSIGEGHLEFLGSVANVAAAKAEIVAGMERGSTLYVHTEVPCMDTVAAAACAAGVRLVTFGTENADIVPRSYAMDANGIEVVMEGVPVRAPLYGIHNVNNLVGAIALASHFGVGPSDAREALAGFENADGRGQVLSGDYTVINDTYNANPLSLRAALRSVSEIYPGRRKIAVLSDMKELGEAAPECHRRSGSDVAKNGFDMLFLYGEMSANYRAGAVGAGMPGASVLMFDTKEELADRLAKTVRNDDVILVKGSRSMKMEDVALALAGRAATAGRNC